MTKKQPRVFLIFLHTAKMNNQKKQKFLKFFREFFPFFFFSFFSLFFFKPVKMAEAPKKRTFRKYSYRGVDLDKLLDLSNAQLIDLLPARPRRSFSNRGMKRKHRALLKRLRAAKRAAVPGFESLSFLFFLLFVFFFWF